MNRRQFAVSLPVAGLLLGCDRKQESTQPSTPPSNTEVQNTTQKPLHPSPLLSNAEVQDAMKSLALAIRNLEVNADRLGDESWLDVVPDVEGSARDVQNSFASLQKAMGVANS
jgi:hypothetical protein